MEGFEANARGRGYSAPAGVDEAGRGPLAGPVVAAAVIFPPGYSHPGIRDSKILSPLQRERLYPVITADAVAFGIALATPEEIDTLNILWASLLAMRRAVEALPLPADFLFIDGIHPVACDVPQETIVGGDDRCVSIAAASILAKVSRDRMMAKYDLLYPGYGLSGHKGYTTREHLEAIRRLGPSPIHRRTFHGVVDHPPEARRAQGTAAEERACRHLDRSGFTIVERNYRTKGGEIDIVASKGAVLVFVEVRSLEVPDFGTPEESVTPAKRRRIVGAARQYLSNVPPSSWREARFDVIAIEGSGDTAELRHYPAAFDAKGKIL